MSKGNQLKNSKIYKNSRLAPFPINIKVSFINKEQRLVNLNHFHSNLKISLIVDIVRISIMKPYTFYQYHTVNHRVNLFSYYFPLRWNILFKYIFLFSKLDYLKLFQYSIIFVPVICIPISEFAERIVVHLFSYLEALFVRNQSLITFVLSIIW